ncbi:MAG: hypothetical protein ONB17_05195 [candidate division KSB1 bacterium]|nr:hypothetical protein [candidate division KSB1 bacterium]MDZ7294335.1 hypothetical protein [candidate division KSB1 bacterium]MDZ7385506.1 hypothetical protein [candidate division KSB1 bacterium]MDZ7393297.1 hypothetical protein [candidate division KSB1 bacterium]MDZ7413167.1 hypothetical protein [candidate division KSB1 bacterium]
MKILSPFARPAPGLPIRRGAPPLRRPTKAEAERFPAVAREFIERTRAEQTLLVNRRIYNLNWMANRHFLLAGGTGRGLGGALAVAALFRLGAKGSLTVIARDLSLSVGYQTGLQMQRIARELELGPRFHWINDGLATEGQAFERVVAALREAGAKEVVYVNTVASASSGLLPGFPPVYVKDIDRNGLFQWELEPLSDKAIETTKHVMGLLAVQFPSALERAGFHVEVTAFADWRGSLDHCSRNPAVPEYGRHGPYSTSLFLPKDIVQAATRAAYKTSRKVIDVFFPVMKTRALAYIPGGRLMALLYDELRRREELPFIDIPELAAAFLHRIGRVLEKGVDNLFPRLDLHEASLDFWFYEVMQRLNPDEDDEFYYKRWIHDDWED